MYTLNAKIIHQQKPPRGKPSNKRALQSFKTANSSSTKKLIDSNKENTSVAPTDKCKPSDLGKAAVDSIGGHATAGELLLHI